MSDDSDEDRDLVGYKHPPKARRFKKGIVSNPHGRPKSKDNILDTFKRMASQKVCVKLNGVPQRMTLGELVLIKNYEQALKGNPSALQSILSIAHDMKLLVDRDDTEQVGKPIAVPRPMSTEEWLSTFGGDRTEYNALWAEYQQLMTEFDRRRGIPPGSVIYG